MPTATIRPKVDPGAAVERIWPGLGARWEPLPGGITNHNFRVDVGGEAFVLRMGGQNTDLLGIDRVNENAAGRVAFAAGVAPETTGFVESEGWLVTRFVFGRRLAPEEMRLPATLDRVAAALRALHGAPPIPGRFDSHQVVVEYARVAEAHGARMPEPYAAALQTSGRIAAARGPQPRVPCHNDLLNANFLDDGRIWIVDWEYAGMGDLFFDLANLSVNHEFGLADDRALLRAYFGAERPQHLAALRLMRFMSDFREAMWGVVQSAVSELDFDFEKYAADHFERLRRTAEEHEFESYLRMSAETASGPTRTLDPAGS